MNLVKWTLALLVLAILAIAVMVARNPHFAAYSFNTASHYLSHIKRIESLHVGNSLTHQGLNWGAALWGNPLSSINFGVPGMRTEKIKAEFEKAVGYRPRYIFLTSGTNDILSRQYSRDNVLKNFQKMIFLAEKQKDICLIITLVPPTSNRRFKERIEHLNKGIVELAIGTEAVLADVTDSISKDGQLLAKFTPDGLHLNEPGYVAWRAELENAVNKCKLKRTLKTGV